MAKLIELPDRSLKIPSEEWISFVNLQRDIILAEQVLGHMKSKLRKERHNILTKLRAGASIENAGRIA